MSSLPESTASLVRLPAHWTVLDLIKASWSLLAAQPVSLLMGAFLVAIPTTCLLAPLAFLPVLPFQFWILRRQEGLPPSWALAAIVSGFGFAFVFAAVSGGWTAGGYTRLCLQVARGERANLARIFVGGATGWSLVQLGLLVVTLVTIPACVVTGLLGLAIFRVPALQGESLTWLPISFMFAAMILNCVVSTVILAGVALSPILVTEEGRGAWDSLGLAWTRMEGARWRLVGAVVLVAVLPQLFVLVLHVITCGMATTFGLPFLWIGQLAILAMMGCMVALVYGEGRRGAPDR